MAERYTEEEYLQLWKQQLGLVPRIMAEPPAYAKPEAEVVRSKATAKRLYMEELFSQGVPDEDIVRICERALDTVKDMRRAWEIERCEAIYKDSMDEVLAEIVELRKREVTIAKMSEILNLPQSFIRKVMRDDR